MTLRNGLSLTVALALAVACGGKSEDGGSGGSGGGGGSGATGGGGSGGTSATGGTSAGGSGGLSATCTSLEQQYAVALALAKACNSLINSIQCTDLVDTELACPCTTYVNPANADAFKQLQDLKLEWAAKKCMEGQGCPAIGCLAPQAGGCQINGAGGDADGCVDYGPD